MVFLASLWAFLIVLPLGWWLSYRFEGMKRELQIVEVEAKPEPFLLAVAALALIGEIVGIWNEWPFFFFGSVWCMVMLEAYWCLEEVRGSQEVEQDQLRGMTRWVYAFGCAGAIPVVLSLLGSVALLASR